jgi:SAM-dependent methyltransferase
MGTREVPPDQDPAISRHRREWDELAGVDPYWAILSDPNRQDGRWPIDEFLATGRAQADTMLARADALGLPAERRTALDFGCGVGRVTQGLAAYFDHVIGVDISETMVDQARALAADLPNCTFRTNVTEELRVFASGSFDMVYSGLVLQHVGSQDRIRGYVKEFARVLSPRGLAVFQLPEEMPARHRLQPRRRLYRVMRSLRVPPDVLQRRLRLYPISMHGLPELEVHDLLVGVNAKLLQVDRTEVEGLSSLTYWFTRP